MAAVNKLSELTPGIVAEYLRLEETTLAEDDTLLSLITVAQSFIYSYTGLTAEEADAHPDFVIVGLILCQDMWDNRTMYVDTGNINKVVDAILNLHSRNLL